MHTLLLLTERCRPRTPVFRPSAIGKRVAGLMYSCLPRRRYNTAAHCVDAVVTSTYHAHNERRVRQGFGSHTPRQMVVASSSRKNNEHAYIALLSPSQTRQGRRDRNPTPENDIKLQHG